jgi:hypothetical protein
VRRSSGGDEGTEATHLVPPVDPYEPFPVIDPAALPAGPAEVPPDRRRFTPAVVFGLVGTLVGLIALAVVVTVNCDRLGVALCRDGRDAAATALLPTLDADRYLITTNPRLPGGLGADVNQLLEQIPAAERPRARAFTKGVAYFVDRLPDARSVVSCGYGTGAPAVRLYADRTAPWSVGLAVVVTGTLVDVFTDGSPCFLGHRIAAMVNLAADGGPDPAFCGSRPSAGFTVLTLGSSVAVCAGLARVPTVPSLTSRATALRPAPGSAPVVQLPVGTPVTVLCQQSGSYRVSVLSGPSTVEEQTGYVAGSDLDLGSVSVPSCGVAPLPSPTFDPSATEVGSCLANVGTAQQPDLKLVDCAEAGSFKVLRTLVGPSIPESQDGGFGAATANQVCAGTEYDTWYGYDTIDDATDVFLCLQSHR